ncbi:FG-GAP-like repeat-containing protein [Lysobacter tyrosinilyticus]
MRSVLLLSSPILLLAALSGGCSKSVPQSGSTASAMAKAQAAAPLSPAGAVLRTTAFAGLADHGDLVAYPAQRVVRKEGASTWYRADISEAHALRAVTSGEITVTAPDGQPIRLQYERHIEHPNGNWTWVGRDAYGEDAVLTFGEKAVFGSIPQHGRYELHLATLEGRSWMVEADPSKQHHPDSKQPDFVVPPELAASLATAATTSTATATATASSPTSAAATATAATTVDVALGYSTGFASELGGDSQAVTRLQNLVDITNQAYANSQINAQIRLVKTLSVNYPDATSNDDTLTKLSGYKSGTGPGTGKIPPDAAFSALRAAREQYGADLVSMVRRFRTPENDGCGIAWLIGGSLSPIDSSDSYFGYSVVSDDLDRGDLDETDHKTYVCRKETLAHELGHNMGQQHNVEDSGGDKGAHEYSYGYRETSTTGFYTVMAYRLPDSSQRAVRYFANPNVIEPVSGHPAGVANSSDNARSMTQTMPLIAQFRATVVTTPTPTFDLFAIGKQGASGKTEVHVMGQQSGYQSYLMNQATYLHNTGSNYQWRFQLGDYNNDGFLDLYAINRMGASGTTEVHILNGANHYQSFLLNTASVLHPTGTDNGWMFRVGDYNQDGHPDIYVIARNGASGHTEVHVMNGATNYTSYLANIATPLPTTGTDGTWNFLLGDYNKDGKPDIYIVLKNNTGSGMTEVHVADGATNFSTFPLHAATALHMTGSDNAWDFKLGDYNNDGTLDLYAIAKQGASGHTEVHVLDGTSTFRTFTAHIATVLHNTGSDDTWEFELGTFR